MNQTKEDLVEKAVRAALNNDWNEAVLLNKKILYENPEDTETLNRLGKSFSQQSKTKEAKIIYRQVLKLDPYNLIAQKNLKALQAKTSSFVINKIDPNLFLEEPGKTKTIVLDFSDPEIAKTFNIGDSLKLVLAKDEIKVLTQQDRFVGVFDKEFSRYLIKLIKIGNKYTAHIFSLDNHQVGIFIREIKRSQKLDDFISFPTAGSRQYRSFLKEDLLSLISEQAEIESLHEDDYHEKGEHEEEPAPDEDGIRVDTDSRPHEDPDDTNPEMT